MQAKSKLLLVANVILIIFNSRSDDADNEENGIPFKKARRQHQPLNEAEKQKRKEARLVFLLFKEQILN
jgi:hypothetical protein